MSATFRIRQLGRNDVREFQQLIKIFEEVFETPARTEPDEAYLARLLENSAFIVMAALNGKDVAGGLTAYELLSYYTAGRELFLYDIAVKPEAQRTGIGRQLIVALKDYCVENGIREMFVAADEEDRHALDFYRATGGEAARVVHFSYRIG